MAGEASTSEERLEPTAAGFRSPKAPASESTVPSADSENVAGNQRTEDGAHDRSCPMLILPTGADQREQYELAEGRAADDKAGDAFFAVPQKWFEQWTEHVGLNQPSASSSVGSAVSAALSFASATAKAAAPAPGKIENAGLIHVDWVDNCPKGVWFAPSSSKAKTPVESVAATAAAAAAKAVASNDSNKEEDEKGKDGDATTISAERERLAAATATTAAAIAAAEELMSDATTRDCCVYDMIAFTPFTSPCSRGTHYRLVNAKQWRLLAGWYGCDVTIPRLMIKEGNASIAKLETSGFTLTAHFKKRLPDKEALFPGEQERRRKEKMEKEKDGAGGGEGVGSETAGSDDAANADAEEEARKAELKAAADRLLNRVEGNAKRGGGGGYAASSTRPDHGGGDNDEEEDSNFVMVEKKIHASRSSRVSWLKKYLVETVFAKEIAEMNAACDMIKKEFGDGSDDEDAILAVAAKGQLSVADGVEGSSSSSSPSTSSPSTGSSSAAASAIGATQTPESEEQPVAGDGGEEDAVEKEKKKQTTNEKKAHALDWSVEYRVWDFMNNKLYAPLEGNESENRTLKESRILDKQAMLLERRGPETLQVWKERKKTTGYGSTYSYGRASAGGAEGREKPAHRGLVGLRNQGNTCFMNSALQCLSNSSLLREYFASGDYAEDINEENPMGTGGKVAHAFGHLMKQMWLDPEVEDQRYGAVASVTPYEFKHELGKKAERFMGFEQQDSNELLSYLLDALHEDLNVVRKKPYIEDDDEKASTDAERATKAWARHLMRERSKIMNMFFGQFRQRLRCTTPGCGNISFKYDPFSSLPVPLPVDNTTELECCLVPAAFDDGTSHDENRVGYGIFDRPIKLSLTVDKRGDLSQCRSLIEEEIKKEIARRARAGPLQNGKDKDAASVWAEGLGARICFADVYHGEIFKHFTDATTVGDAKRNVKLFAFESYKSEAVSADEYAKEMAREAAKENSRDGSGDMKKKTGVASEESNPADEAPEQKYGDGSSAQVSEDKVDGGEEDKDKDEDEDTRHPWLNISVVLREGGEKTRSTYGGGSYTTCTYTILGLPLVIPVKAGKTTVKELREMVWQRCRRLFVPRDAKAGEDCIRCPADEAQDWKRVTATPEELQRAFALHFEIKSKCKSSTGEVVSVDIEPGTEIKSEEREEIAEKEAVTTIDPRISTTSADAGYSYGSSSSVVRSARRAGAQPPCKVLCVTMGGRAKIIAAAVARGLLGKVCHPTIEEVSSAGTAASSASGTVEAQEKLNIYDCLDKFSEEHQLDPMNEWYCSKCKQHVRALIKTQIWRAPKLLMVQLKRFTHTNAGYSSYGFFGRGAGLGEKVSTPVDFPVRGLSLESYVACKGWPGAAKDEDNDDDDGDDIEEEQEGRAGAVTASTGSTEIDEKDGEEAGEREKKEEGEEEKKEAAAVDNKVTPAIYKMAQKAAVQREKPVYDLYAVSNHMGGVGGGHYIAHALNEGTGKWYQFDDSRVTLAGDITGDITEDEKGPAREKIVNPTAYVLFYKLREEAGPGRLKRSSSTDQASGEAMAGEEALV